MKQRFQRLLILLLTSMFLVGTAHAVDFEVGYEIDFDQGNALYIYATEDIRVLKLPFDSYLWFSPAAEIELRSPIEGWVQAQFLFDTTPGTVSVRGKWSFPSGDVHARVGLLFEF